MARPTRTANVFTLLLLAVASPGCGSDLVSTSGGGSGSTGTTTSIAASTSSTSTSSTSIASTSGGAECAAAGDGSECSVGLCCAGTCTVVDSNPANCGACGRTCASCTGSACAPEVLETYTSAAAVNDIFVDPDGSHVYWTVYGGNDPTAGGVFRRSLTTEATQAIFANTPQYASVAVQGSQLIVTIAVMTTASGVYKCPKDACSALVRFGTELPHYPQGTPHLAVTTTQVSGQYYPSGNVQSFRCNAAVCSNQSGAGGAYYVAADASFIYRTSTGGDLIETFAHGDLNASSKVYKVLGGGASPRQVHVAADGFLYWYEYGNQTISRGALGQAPGSVETVATGVDNTTFDMVERDGTLYWIDSAASGWVVESCTADDCAATRRVIGAVDGKPQVMAVSSQHVYVGTTQNPGPPSYLERFPR